MFSKTEFNHKDKRLFNLSIASFNCIFVLAELKYLFVTIHSTRLIHVYIPKKKKKNAYLYCFWESIKNLIATVWDETEIRRTFGNTF